MSFRHELYPVIVHSFYSHLQCHKELTKYLKVKVISCFCLIILFELCMKLVHTFTYHNSLLCFIILCTVMFCCVEVNTTKTSKILNDVYNIKISIYSFLSNFTDSPMIFIIFPQTEGINGIIMRWVIFRACLPFCFI